MRRASLGAALLAAAAIACRGDGGGTGGGAMSPAEDGGSIHAADGGGTTDAGEGARPDAPLDLHPGRDGTAPDRIVPDGPVSAPCAPPPPACPRKILEGAQRVDRTNVAMYEGVTEIAGKLVVRDLEGMQAFACLEEVDGDLELDAFTAKTPSLVGAFPRLRVVGGSISLTAGSQRVPVDCGFLRSFERGGTKVSTGGSIVLSHGLAGELDLRAVRDFRRIEVRHTHLQRVILPSNGSFKALQMRIENNLLLRTLDGLTGATLTGASQLGFGFSSLRVIGNPLLPACRAEELARQFVDAGYPATSITVSMNGPACP